MKIEFRVVAIVDTKIAYPSTGKIHGIRNTDNNFSSLQDAEEWVEKHGEKYLEYTIVKVFVPQ